MSQVETKRKMRSRIRAERLKLRPGEAQVRSNAACKWVIESPEFASAVIVALYRAMPGEVITDDIFEAARRAGKTVLYPIVVEGRPDLKFCVIDRLDEMTPGKWDILEPRPDAETRAAGDFDLVIIPGVAFDRSGGRLGQGGGFYDRILKSMRPDAVKMGIAYELQIVDEVPREAHDELIDCLAVESGIIRFRKVGGEH